MKYNRKKYKKQQNFRLPYKDKMFVIAVKKTIELSNKQTQIEQRRNSWSSRDYFSLFWIKAKKKVSQDSKILFRLSL